MKRLLVLEDGTVFEGEAFGADLYVTGELVFTTAMTGFQELITDQAFSGQILSFTFPVIGAAGINRDDSESITPTCLAVVVQHLVEMPSNWQQMTLDEFLKRKKIPGIVGIDTRQVAKIVRKFGRMKATVINKGIQSTISWISCEQRSFPKIKCVKSRQNSLCCTRFW